MNVLMLNEAELRRCAVMNDLSLAAIEDAFTWLHAGRVSMPPIMHVGIPDHNGDVDIKGAYVRGLDQFAVKIASGFYANSAAGLPSSNAMVVVLSAKTGFCEAILLDNGYLTDLRTGLAGAVAAKHLAPSVVDTVGVIGTGAQARCQVQCLTLVRQFRQVLVHGRNPEHVAACVADLEAATGLPARAAADAAQLVAQSQVVITTTGSNPITQWKTNPVTALGRLGAITALLSARTCLPQADSAASFIYSTSSASVGNKASLRKHTLRSCINDCGQNLD